MPPVRPIVLLTDFGTKDIYAASMKGVILSRFPQASIVDLSHEVEPQNITQAAFLLESSYRYFPRGSIFVIVVDPGVGSARRILAAKTEQGIFLAPDNGVLTRVLENEKRYELRSVTHRHFFSKEISPTFHGRDCFAPTAAALAKKPSLFSRLGPPVRGARRFLLPKPHFAGGKVRGEILFFDRFGNAFTNISRDRLKPSGSLSRCQVRVGGRKIGTLRRAYYEVRKGQALAVFNSSNFLEIAVNQGSARNQLGLRERGTVEVFQS